MEEVIFIDPDGNIIQYNEICSHIGLAVRLINENEELKQRYIDAGCPMANLYLIIYEGYISVSIDPVYGMNLTANNQRITNIQREIMNNYLICGAKLSLMDEESENIFDKGRHSNQR